ncbi:MAG: hypothetical protein H9W81_07415 [Enterococcus sp.]|nr:hypothetical protein [Enterococcus sp.]
MKFFTKVVGGVAVSVAVGVSAIGGIAYAINNQEEKPLSAIDQVTAVGMEFDEWFLAHPANDTIFPRGEDYGSIAQSTIHEEPADGLDDKRVFYFSRGEDNYAICVAESRDPAEISSPVYVYFSQSQQTMEHDRCTIENLINPEVEK